MIVRLAKDGTEGQRKAARRFLSLQSWTAHREAIGEQREKRMKKALAPKWPVNLFEPRSSLVCTQRPLCIQPADRCTHAKR